MQIVNEKQNSARGISGRCHGANCVLAHPFGCNRLAANAIDYAIKKLNRLRLAVNAEFKVLRPEVIYKLALLVENGNTCLNQFSADAHNVIRRFLGLLVKFSFQTLGTRRLLFLRLRRVQGKEEQEEE